jgi:hypothetical protein
MAFGESIVPAQWTSDEFSQRPRSLLRLGGIASFGSLVWTRVANSCHRAGEKGETKRAPPSILSCQKPGQWFSP